MLVPGEAKRLDPEIVAMADAIEKVLALYKRSPFLAWGEENRKGLALQCALAAHSSSEHFANPS